MDGEFCLLNSSPIQGVQMSVVKVPESSVAAPSERVEGNHDNPVSSNHQAKSH